MASKESADNNPGLHTVVDGATKGYFSQQTMLRVKDPKVSLDFYSRIMGMSLLKSLDFSELKFTLYFLGYEDTSAAPSDPIGRTAWTFGQKAVLELTHNWGTETDNDFKGYHNGNSEPRGFGITVDNVHKACERLESLGVEFVKKPTDGKIRDIAFVKDPDGYWIEIFDTANIAKAQVWSNQEDIALMSAWCFTSTNAIVGTNQNSAKLWANVLHLYEQRRVDTPGMGERTVESLRSRYKRLNKNVTKWITVYKKAHDIATSSQSKEDIEKTAQQLYGNGKFTHHEVFERVMCHNPKWELNLNSTGSTHSQPDEDDFVESRGSSKRSRTCEDVDLQINSTLGSGSSGLQRSSGRDKAKVSAKRKEKDVASQSQSIPNHFTATLHEMRLTRERECEIQERKIKVACEMQERNIKAATLNTLISKEDLSLEEASLKRHLVAVLFGL